MPERRKFTRKASLARCFVERLFASSDRFQSRVVNYSDKGLMLDLDYPLELGDPIRIRFETSSEGGAQTLTECCVGVVRWVARQHDGLSGLFGVGVELIDAFPTSQSLA